MVFDGRTALVSCLELSLTALSFLMIHLEYRFTADLVPLDRKRSPPFHSYLWQSPSAAPKVEFTLRASMTRLSLLAVYFRASLWPISDARICPKCPLTSIQESMTP